MIYLDHAATTPLDPKVVEVMRAENTTLWGNPSSPHACGREARAAIDKARRVIAEAFHVRSHEVVFVSSGSEANCLAIFGTTERWEQEHGNSGNIILTAVEHSCSMKVVDKLKTRGWDVTLLPVDGDGLVKLKDVEQAIRNNTALVSVQWANNEVGTVQPVEEVYALCKNAGIPFHTDAVQIIGQLPVSDPPPCDMFSIAAHKFYGPKGIGALIVRENIHICPQILGGGQEFNMRAGTENTPGIVGMAKALELALVHQNEEAERLTVLRDTCIRALSALPGITLNGSHKYRLPNNINIHIAGVTGETLVAQLDLRGVCCSTGSACVTGAGDASHVLKAMGRSNTEASQNVRFSLGRSTSQADLDKVLAILQEILIPKKSLAKAIK